MTIFASNAHRERFHDGRHQVLSPYYDEAEAKRLYDLDFIHRIYPVASLIPFMFLGYLTVGLIGFVAGGAAGGETGEDGMSESAAVLVGGIAAGVYTAFLIGWGIKRAINTRTRRRLAAKQDAYWVTASPTSLIDSMASMLRRMDQEGREELRPVWDEAVAAHELYSETFDHDASARLRARHDAVWGVQDANNALAEAKRHREARTAYGFKHNDEDLDRAAALRSKIQARKDQVVLSK